MILNKSLSLFQALSRVGAEDLHPADARRVILTNRVNMLLATVATFFMFAWATKGSWFMVASNVFFLWFHSTLIWMNKKRWYFLPKFLLVVLVSSAIFMIVGMQGKIGDFQVCLIPIAGFSILLFDPKEKVQMTLGVLYPLVLLGILVIFDYKLFPNLVGEPLPGLTIFTYSMNLIMVISTAIYFYRTHFQTEKKYQNLYEKLVKAQKQLDEERAKAIYASKMGSIGEMAGGIAHEINGPLWLVTVSAEQLKNSVNDKSLDSDKLLHLANRITETSKKMAEIIRALSNMSRSAATTPSQAVCLKSLISDTLIICNHRFYLKSIKLEVQVPDGLPHVNCRAVEIGQVLLNLLNNAFDAVSGTPDPVIEIIVSLAQGKIQLKIQDNGPGVPPELHDRIFEAFFTTKELGKGTGLGLSISRKIIEQNNGKMFLDANAEKTSFVVELPV